MGDIVLAGATSGTITLQPTAVAGSNTLTLPAANATLATLTTPSFASTIGVGGATAAASGAGITFPATQSASTDANTLDDYEEGNFTPNIIGGATAGTATYLVRHGSYIKIGKMVYVNIHLNWSGGTGTGALQVSGLPFTAVNTANELPAITIYVDSIVFPAGTFPQGYIINNTTRMDLIYGAPSVTGFPIAYDAAGALLITATYVATA